MFLADLLPRPTIWNGTKAVLLSTVIYIFASDISGGLQYFETCYIEPVYAIHYDSSEVIRAYERELFKNTDMHEYNIIRDSVRSMEMDFSLDPGSIYECAYPECGLNPFIIRSDGVAAGFIQFTSAGVQYLGVTLSDVKAICRNRDAGKMMNLTRRYLQRCGLNGGNGADVYTAVFAPAFLKRPDDAVLYAGRNNPAYNMNAQIDGYVMKGGKIFRDFKAVDYKITKGELRLWMERKKIELITKNK